MSRANIREIALAAVITAVIALGPLTPNELGPSLLIGVAVAGVVAFWRLRRRAPIDAEGADAAGETSLQIVPLLGWLGLASLWALAFLPTLRWLGFQWTYSVWANDHGIFMPFIMGYLVWNILRQDPEIAPESSALGFPLLGVGVLASLVDVFAGTKYLGMAGLLISLPGLSLLLLGRRRTRMLGVPLVLSLLMTPVPISLAAHLYLRFATAAAVEPLIRAIGTPVLREDTVLRLSSGTFVVANACSGFSTLYASIAVALVLAFLTRSTSRRIAILLVAPLLAVAANIVRVTSLVLIAHFFGQWTLDTPLHEATGVAAFIAIAIMLSISCATATWFDIHPRRQDHCRNPATLAITSLIPDAKHVRQRSELPDSIILWAEGEFPNPLSDSNPFHYQIVRGYNTLRISTHPLSLIANDVDGETQRLMEIQVEGQS
ncbi:MAG: exosortase/archaeosortase family protein, partial [Deltaproteobacteria bacterium]|nr:exosortase/archaeosortase family protein [Deltaproteobacteria bacterium]